MRFGPSKIDCLVALDSPCELPFPLTKVNYSMPRTYNKIFKLN